MHVTPSNESHRLRLLNLGDPHSPWGSCGEKRHCILCEKTFRGSAILLEMPGTGPIRLRCPSADCAGTPDTWVRCGNPLLDGEAGRDWDRILETAEVGP